MSSNLITALINTVIMIMAIPTIGFVIDRIVNAILKFTASYLGVGITMFIANRLTFLGTVHHEISHALSAFLTGAKVTKIDLFKPQGNTLGKVMFYPRGNVIFQSIQLTMSAIAPVVTGMVTIYLLSHFGLANCEKPWQYIIVIYLLFSILFHMTMSGQDIKNALTGLPICAIIIFVIIYFTEFNILTLLNIK